MLITSRVPERVLKRLGAPYLTTPGLRPAPARFPPDPALGPPLGMFADFLISLLIFFADYFAGAGVTGPSRHLRESSGHLSGL